MLWVISTIVPICTRFILEVKLEELLIDVTPLYREFLRCKSLFRNIVIGSKVHKNQFRSFVTFCRRAEQAHQWMTLAFILLVASLIIKADGAVLLSPSLVSIRLPRCKCQWNPTC
jgi:hypothetical protein